MMPGISLLTQYSTFCRPALHHFIKPTAGRCYGVVGFQIGVDYGHRGVRCIR